MDKSQQPLSTGMQQDLSNLREEIRQFADTLYLFENSTDVPSAEDTIKTLRGISLGAFSCAELLAMALKKSGQTNKVASSHKKPYQDQLKEKVNETLQCCTSLSTSLHSLKQLLRSMHGAELVGMEQASQRVQAALSNIATEWEDL
ncbi:hypothetical protein [Anaerolinea sp.]|uniref:hypothetical protein n=1 Tax=Anaerolinea sp. TaxID=1872519 RepID=UPI002ACDD039|nr:hypothetical protein [Anaerolinea sp.]